MIYLDNNATTAVAPETLEAMVPFLGGQFGNPSSAHTVGRRARAVIEEAREAVSGLIGASFPSEIVFTSGGTESDNTAILGALRGTPEKRRIVTTRVEHEAVRKLVQRLEPEGFSVCWIDVDEDGLLDLDAFENALTPDTAIVSVMLANNETGILFPVERLAQIVKKRSNALFHVDGVNAAGKVAIDVKNTEIDLFSISAHKFHGPKGVGALYVRSDVELPSYLIGGGQEQGRRAGTEAVHQIAGMAAAAKLVEDVREMKRVAGLRDRLESGILDRIPNSRLNGTADPSKRLPNTSNISFENTNGEMILAALDDIGVCVSTGSACNSYDHTASAVLQAMNVPYRWAMGSIRFSLGRYNTLEEIDFVLEKLPGIVERLRSLS
jgi:cysteine desulfurase